MAIDFTYALPVEQTCWAVGGETETVLRWQYADGRDALLKLYDKGKQQQWDAASRIDWSLDLDPDVLVRAVHNTARKLADVVVVR